MYDAWTADQRNAIMWSIINLGLNYGLNSYTNESSGYSWWQTTNGNWNCVCNGGLTMGALAILNEDPTGVAQRVLGYTVDNAAGNCMQAVSSDGTWSETSDYWYFGSTATAQMISALQTATGSDHGLLDANPNYSKTGLFHMYGTGFVQKFDYGVSSCTILWQEWNTDDLTGLWTKQVHRYCQLHALLWSSFQRTSLLFIPTRS